jgi:lipopolysaccharide transport system permease protein
MVSTGRSAPARRRRGLTLLPSLRAELRALWTARGLLKMMVRREIAARHAGSVLGVVWLYVQPVLTIAAYYLVFDVVFQMRLGEHAPTRAVGAYLIVGMVPWIAFCEATSRGMGSLLEAGTLLQKNPLPPALFPARAVAASAVVYLPLTLLLVAVYSTHHRFSAWLLLLPLLLALLLVIWFLLAYILAILAAALRDVVQIVTFLLGIGVFLSPVLFPPAMFPSSLAWLLWLNPITPGVLGVQALLLVGRPPEAEVWLGLASWLAVSVVALDRLLARSREQLVDWL